ncbi:MAG: DUF3047 domain-containing protein [Nitrospirae bacterium]|nr:DUF3047 domain-containing protein [Nitrospirota bacterium]
MEKIVKIAFVLIAVFLSTDSFGEQTIVIGFDGNPDPKGVPSGWELKEKKGKADFKVLTEGEEKVIFMKSVVSSFSLQKDIKINLKEYPYLTFRWKVVKLPDGGDVRKGKTNDQALQTMIAFEEGKILSYIWDTTAPQGTVSEESVPWPISLQIKVLTLKSGTQELGQWVTITRNVYEDFNRLFGEEPPPIEGIRVQINSQHTRSTAESYFGKMLFRKTKD